MTESPKSLFLQVHADAAKVMAEITQNRELRLSVAFSLAQMAWNGATKEQIAGANDFAGILMGIGGPDEKAPTLPIRQLAQG